VVNQNRDEHENKIDELTHEVRAVTSSLDKCNSSIQMNKRNYLLEIQRLGSQIEDLREKVNGSLPVRLNQPFAPPLRLVRLLG
jgi:uncharacterized coiled-coil DUF342 family protein